jgi:isopentenyl-diphosphate delta-isomerase
MTTAIAGRKADHIDLCATGDVGFKQKTTLFEEVELVHDALPELSLDEIDMSVDVFGKPLRAPLLIAAMTGGTDKARAINRELAQIAEQRGYGFGLGSQRAMLESRSKGDTYEVRDVAPEALVLGNIGAVQARSMASDAVLELAKNVGADAMCVHLNPAMELVQPEGDRYFRGALGAIERLVGDLSIPVIAKETGCGLGPGAIRRLAHIGVRHVDVSGAGGTSWVAVETERAVGAARTLGESLREWGVPTAASVQIARRARPRFKTIIATGGVQTGLEVAKAICLGATIAGIARPVLQAFTSGGREGAIAYLDQVEAELRAVMLLVGARDLAALRDVDVMRGPNLLRWDSLAKRRLGSSKH